MGRTGSNGGFFGAYLRLSRFEVLAGAPVDNPVADPASDVVMLKFRLYNGSHRGGGMVFGKDGCLYLTIGDQFRCVTAQDISQTFERGAFRLERTLYTGFRERFGMSPQAYLAMLRMDTKREALISAPPETRETDIALDAGITHLGRFSTDYRRRFGESPSATVSRNKHCNLR